MHACSPLLVHGGTHACMHAARCSCMVVLTHACMQPVALAWQPGIHALWPHSCGHPSLSHIPVAHTPHTPLESVSLRKLGDPLPVLVHVRLTGPCKTLQSPKPYRPLQNPAVPKALQALAKPCRPQSPTGPCKTLQAPKPYRPLQNPSGSKALQALAKPYRPQSPTGPGILHTPVRLAYPSPQVVELVNRLGPRLVASLEHGTLSDGQGEVSTLWGRVGREEYVSSKLGSKLSQQVRACVRAWVGVGAQEAGPEGSGASCLLYTCVYPKPVHVPAGTHTRTYSGTCTVLHTYRGTFAHI